MKYYGIKINYLILLICIFGYIWIYFNNFQNPTIQVDSHGFNVCIFKNITSYPCPSCGTTRSVSLLIKGNFFNSLMLNPFGFLVTSIIIIFPFWIIFDLIYKKTSFEDWFLNLNKYFQNKWILFIFILIVLSNWIWNIYKNL